MSNELYLNDTKLNDPINDLQDGIVDPTQSQEQSPPGFFSSLRNPMELVLEESLPASLYQFITGNTKKVQAEKALKFLQKYPQLQGTGQYNEAMRIYKKFGYLLEEDKEHSFDAKEILNLAKKYPSVFGAELINMLIADPYLLLLPSTIFSKLGRGIVNAGKLNFSSKLSKIPNRMRNVIRGRAIQDIKSGAMASVLMPFAFTTGLQLGEKGEIDPNRTIAETTFGATAGLLTSAALGGISAIAQRSTLVPSKTINDIINRTIAANEGEFFKIVEGQRLGIKQIHKKLNDEILNYNENQLNKLTAHTEAANRQLINNAEDSIKSIAIKAASIGSIGATAQFLTEEKDKLKESAYGFAIGSGIYFAYKGLNRLIKNTTKLSDLELNFEAKLDSLQINNAKINGYAVDASNKLKNFLPDVRSRQKIFHFINGTKIDHNLNYNKNGFVLTINDLSYREKLGVTFVKKYFDNLDLIINKELKDSTFKFAYRSNYLPLIFNYIEDSPFQFVEKIYGSGTKSSRFFKRRAFENINEALEKKFVLKNGMDDPVALMQIYTNSISKALSNKILYRNLTYINNGTKLPIGKNGRSVKIPMLISEKNAHAYPDFSLYYQEISHPLLGKEKHYIHKDIVKSLNMLFEAKTESQIMSAVFNINLMMKRSAVAASFFHAGALVESMFFGGVPFKVVGQFLKPRSKNQIMNLIDNPSLTLENFNNAKFAANQLEFRDLVSFARAARLEISTPEDVGYDRFYSILQKIDNDVFKPHFGIKPGAAIEKVYKWFDRITWDRIFTQAKLYTFLTQLDRTVSKGDDIATIYAKAKRAAIFTNDAFGGQNWFALTQTISNKYLKRFSQTLFKPGSRGYMQLAMFAPDWTISNLRIVGRALPGFNEDPISRRAYQYYVLRASLMFATVGTALNYIFSGHSQLENKDPTRIDLGNGQVLTFSKQLMEPFHWVTDPQNTAIKKIGSLPKGVIEVLTNKEYLTTKWSPNITTKDDNAIEKFYKIGGKLGEKFLPIWLLQSTKTIKEQLERDGLSPDLAINVSVDFVLGQLGHPRYKSPRSSQYKLAGLARSPYETLF